MAKKHNQNIIEFFDPIYMQEFMVIFAPTHTKFREIIKKEIGFNTEEVPNGVCGEFHGLESKRCGSLALIWASDKANSLWHEVFHACYYVLRNREIHLTPDSEESYAYYYSYIMRTIKNILDYQKREERHGKK
jgi:hypothetical protein